MSTLPPVVEDEPQLEELLARPSAADVEFARSLQGDVIVLGAGGKMGPSLARRIRRSLEQAGVARRVLAVARFSEPGLAKSLAAEGIEPIACDLLDASAVARLPKARNVLFLAGRKFGSSDRPDLTWAHNVIVPSIVAAHFRDSRIVAFSSGNVYPLVPPSSTGSTEKDRVDPVGEYAQTCVGRERIFEHAARERGTPCLLFRLFYSVDLRYGTLVDLARTVRAGETVDARAAHVNAIWQGDANSYAFRGALTRRRARPGRWSSRARTSSRCGRSRSGSDERFGRPVRFVGSPGPALLGDPLAAASSLLGPPEVASGPPPRLGRGLGRARRPQPGQAHALRGDRWPLLRSSAGRSARGS